MTWDLHALSHPLGGNGTPCSPVGVLGWGYLSFPLHPGCASESPQLCSCWGQMPATHAQKQGCALAPSSFPHAWLLQVWTQAGRRFSRGDWTLPLLGVI